jgi:hypothetical protein
LIIPTLKSSDNEGVLLFWGKDAAVCSAFTVHLPGSSKSSPDRDESLAIAGFSLGKRDNLASGKIEIRMDIVKIVAFFLNKKPGGFLARL